MLAKKKVLASRVIGKGCTGLLKLCGVLGLCSPIAKSCFTEHLKVFEEKAFILCDEKLKKAASRARDLTIREQNLAHSLQVADIPTSFGGTWSSCRWTASRGFVTAITEISSQVIDVSYKCRVCNQYNIIEGWKKNRLLFTIEHLEQIIEHEPSCFKNHSGSPQVRFLIQLVMTL